jgi:hypothetical protein
VSRDLEQTLESKLPGNASSRAKNINDLKISSRVIGRDKLHGKMFSLATGTTSFSPCEHTIDLSFSTTYEHKFTINLNSNHFQKHTMPYIRLHDLTRTLALVSTLIRVRVMI